jgi:hypothetical protein
MQMGDSDTQKIKTLQPGMREKTNGQRNESLTLAQIQKTTTRSDKHEARRYVNVLKMFIQLLVKMSHFLV